MSEYLTDDECDEIVERAIATDKAVHGIRASQHETDVLQRPDLGREIVRQAFEVFTKHANKRHKKPAGPSVLAQGLRVKPVKAGQ